MRGSPGGRRLERWWTVRYLVRQWPSPWDRLMLWWWAAVNRLAEAGFRWRYARGH